MQYILNWDCGLTHHRSAEETNSFFVASASDIRGPYVPNTPALVGDPPPVCVSCQERLSVEHILIYCADMILEILVLMLTQ